MQKTHRSWREREGTPLFPDRVSYDRLARFILATSLLSWEPGRGNVMSYSVVRVLRLWQTLIFKTTTENSTLQLLCVFIPKVGYVILFLWTLLVLSLSNCILFTCIYTLNLRKGKGAIALSTSYLLIYIEKTNTFKLETSFILGTENTVSWLHL